MIVHLCPCCARAVAATACIATQAFAFLFKYFRLAGGWMSLEAVYNVARVR